MLREPLDDGDVNSFFDDDFEVDVDFRVVLRARRCRTAGRRGEDVEIKVTAK